MSHSHSPLLGLPFFHTRKSIFVYFCDFTVTTHHLISTTSQDCLVVWPYKVCSHEEGEDLPRSHHVEGPSWSPKHDADGTHCSADRFQGSLHPHGDVERHRLVPKKTMKRLVKVISSSVPEHDKRLSQRTLDIPRIWIWRKTVCYARPWTRWFVGQGHQKMMLLFAASGHLVVRGTSPSSRGPLKRKCGGKTLIFDNAEPTIAELLLCIVIPVNQLSIYGAVADWYQELPQRVEVHCP